MFQTTNQQTNASNTVWATLAMKSYPGATALGTGPFSSCKLVCNVIHHLTILSPVNLRALKFWTKFDGPPSQFMYKLVYIPIKYGYIYHKS